MVCINFEFLKTIKVRAYILENIKKIQTHDINGYFYTQHDFVGCDIRAGK